MKLLSIFNKAKKPVTTFEVLGMHCASCAAMIESELEDAGYRAKCSYAKQKLEIESTDVDPTKVRQIVKSAGYDIKI